MDAALNTIDRSPANRPNYEARWRTGDLTLPDYGCPLWQGEPLDHHCLLLVAEQGYGDTLLAARFIPVIKAQYPNTRITLECKPELHRIFAGLGVHLAVPGTVLPGTHDYFCPLMSLMGVLGINESNVPPPVHITVPDDARRKFGWLKQHAAGRKKIGIVWSGSVTFKDNERRRAPMEQFLQLADQPGVQLYSFQKGAPQKELYQAGAVPLVVDLASQLEDFADTAAAVEHMDMIVMTDSSLAHLAGSMGKPVINLLQYRPYWLYVDDARMRSWYPAMQSVRQQKLGGSESMFERLIKNTFMKAEEKR